MGHSEISHFLVKDRNEIIAQEGDVFWRHSPCSTFKIALALMGFDSGLLKDDCEPVWEFKEEYLSLLPRVFDMWKEPHSPKLWMKNSAVWYSQVLTQKIGLKKFTSYVEELKYGNMDLTGDSGKHNGLTHSWLSSSLKISVSEQVDFLQSLISDNLSFDAQSVTKTKKILSTGEVINGWDLYGKTGSGWQLNEDGTRDENRQIGWYVGWLERQNRTIIFAHFLEDLDKQETMAGIRSRELTKKKITKLLDEHLEKEK
jgi:beta-lactamase class D